METPGEYVTDAPPPPPPGFEAWAFVEIMGHNELAGKISEQLIAGTPFLRVDVPELDGIPAYTRIFSPKAIYCINPCTEDTCRRIAAKLAARPIGELVEFTSDDLDDDDPHDDDEDDGMTEGDHI